MATLKREVAVNIIGSVVATVILIGLGRLVTYLSAETGVYLDVSQQINSYDSLHIISIRAENSSSFGLSPVEISLPSTVALRAAAVRSEMGASTLTPLHDKLNWKGSLAAHSAMDVVLVFNGTMPEISPPKLFSAKYTMINEKGFSTTRPATVRLESEATVARLWLVAKWLAVLVTISAVLLIVRVTWGRRSTRLTGVPGPPTHKP